MPQQINLCTPLFQTQKRYFSALTMAQALGVFLLLGGVLAAYWSWTLQNLSAGYEQSVATNQREIDRLQAALLLNRANAGPADAALLQELQARREELQQREQLLAELQRGLLREGQGHAARLQLVARTIPPQAWVSSILADTDRLELGGYTLEPAALNGWMARLADSPLLQGQQLSVVKVERVVPDSVPAAAVRPAAGVPYWAYTLVTAVTPRNAAGEGRP